MNPWEEDYEPAAPTAPTAKMPWEEDYTPAKLDYTPAPEGIWAAHPLSEAVGGGMVRGGRRIGRLGVDAYNKVTGNTHIPDALTDEAFAEEDAINAPLKEQTLGKTGFVVGETLPTLPAGGAAANTLKAVGARVIPQALRTGLPSLLGRGGAGAVEGAVQGEIGADPDNRDESAVFGGGIGGAFGAGGRILGRTLASGLAKGSDAWNVLKQYGAQHGKELFAPLVQATAGTKDLATNLTRQVYKYGLPNVLGVEGRIANQTAQLNEDLRTMALKEADFGNVLNDDAGKKVRESLEQLTTSSDDAFRTAIKGGKFWVPDTLDDYIEYTVRQKAPNAPPAHIKEMQDQIKGIFNEWGKKNADNGLMELSGDNMLKVRDDFQNLINGAKSTRKDQYWAVKPVFDKIIKSGMDMNDPIDKAKWELYQTAQKAYTQLQTVRKAAKAAPGGNFDMRKLDRAAGTRDDVLSDLAETALPTSTERAASPLLPGALRRLNTPLQLAATGGAALASVPITAASIGGAHVLANKSTQKALMGELGWQRALADALRKHPGMMQDMRTMGQGVLLQENQNEP